MSQPTVAPAPPGGRTYFFGEAFSRHSLEEEAALLRAEIMPRNGLTNDAVVAIVEFLRENPRLRKTFAEDSRWTSLRSIYVFRVMTGLESPKSVNDTGFLDAPGQTQKAGGN